MRMLKRLSKSIIFWVVSVEVCIAIIFYLYGFRITYDPSLETSWEAVGAIGQWAGTIVGILIPVIVIYLQENLERNRQEIGESNLELYNEFEGFKQEYSEKLKIVSNMIDNNDTIIVDGGKFADNSSDNLKEKALKLINISMIINTHDVAEHLDISEDEAFDLLVEMLKHDESISAGGYVSKENIKDILWTKRKKR